MIYDYEDIVSGAVLTGSRVSNDCGTCTVIENDLPLIVGMSYEDYYGIQFLDIETTGLSGIDQPLFLIGLLAVKEDRLSCTQLLAKKPDEESAILLQLLSFVKERSAVMTFNGDSFDIPYIERRMGYSNISLPEIISVDLLRPARKRYKDRLASCSLQSLERNILGLADWNREDDIPGEKIPRLYWNYVNNGDYSILIPIIRHNIMDLISTARLWSILMRP